MKTQPAPALNGKVLVVIGASSGIGLSAARAFVAQGARVAGCGLDQGSVREAAEELGESALLFQADATAPETAERAIGEALSRFGSFHGLYHVAGGSGRRWGDSVLHELTDEGWTATLNLNLTSLMLSNRAAVRQFLAQGGGGVVLNLASVLAFSPSPGHFATHAYATAKAGVIGLTKSCAACYAPSGIRFNVLAPGLVATPMSRRAQQDPLIMRKLERKQPLDGGRIGQPEDLDAAAVYLMSDGARFVTGQVLAVDGGWSVTDGATPKA